MKKRKAPRRLYIVFNQYSGFWSAHTKLLEARYARGPGELVVSYGLPEIVPPKPKRGRK